jgi:hypothetical protein
MPQRRNHFAAHNLQHSGRNWLQKAAEAAPIAVGSTRASDTRFLRANNRVASMLPAGQKTFF